MTYFSRTWLLLCLLAGLSFQSFAFTDGVLTEEDSLKMDAVWVPDNGDGTYTNPIIYADYSDPDVVKVGDDFYMVSSSFNSAPGLPILHSKDLVNWTVINYVFQQQSPDSIYKAPGHGNGVWAPSIRYHKGTYYVYYGNPDLGIFMAKTTDPAAPWDYKLVHAGYGLIDPCPFWDDNDSAYLVNSYANSRTGFKSTLCLRRMSQDGETLSTTDTVVIVSPQDGLETIEGPKMYKRNGFYYVFAPYGGVAQGSQVVLRSDNVWGPYQDTTVLEQGSTNINGPHQGGYVELESGESWFIHFQEKLPQGRIVHLQPMSWENDWPKMGEDFDSNGIGEPVTTHAKPNVGATYSIANPQTTDKFNQATLGLQWQWHSNYQSAWFSLTDQAGSLRLNAVDLPDTTISLWDVGSMLLQKLPANTFSATAKVKPNLQVGEKTGLLFMAQNYSYLAVTQTDSGLVLGQYKCLNARSGGKETKVAELLIQPDSAVYLRAVMADRGLTSFSYSFNGRDFVGIGTSFSPDEGRWIGVKMGLFCHQPAVASGNGGYADYDWFCVDEAFPKQPGATFNPTPANDSSFVVKGLYHYLQWEGDMAFTDSFYVYLDTVPSFGEPIAKQRGLAYKHVRPEVGKTYYWRVDALNDKGIAEGPVWHFTVDEPVGIGQNSLGADYALRVSGANPTKSVAQISYTLPATQAISIGLYTLTGEQVQVLASGTVTNGTYTLGVDKGGLAAGTYIVTMEVDGKALTQMIVFE